MSGKKHPLLTVLAILAVSAFILGTGMFIILKVFAPSANISFNEKIGVISIEGTISESMRITSQLVNMRKNKRIKAIILRINSPGGSVGPAQEIYREVQKTIETKKVIVSMGGVAASGGYYIAAAANKIVAEPGTITGSIGVIIEFVLLKDLINNIGIKFEVLKSGEFKDVGSPHREMTERDRELVKDLIADIQNQFVEAVAKGRNLDEEQVKKIADGRVFSGARAKELGLIDVLGNFQDAVETAKEMAGITGEVTLVYPKKSGMELWERFMDSAAGSLAHLLQGINSKVEYRWSGFVEH